MVAIIDYGVGNLFSLRSSFAAIGEQAEVTGDAARIAQADRVILPGVGAFADAYAKLCESGMDEAVRRAMHAAAGYARGGYAAAMRAGETVYACREQAAALFGVRDPARVVFTMNATHALNLAIHALAQPGMRVVVSGYEHNAVMRPLLLREIGRASCRERV